MSLITLLTDFGDRDAYVGVMKGVMASICATDATVSWVDLTHRIPPQDVAAARFHLQTAWPYFPVGTIHLAVVDPGVGSDRHGVAIQFAGGYLVGPDNGIFSGILADSPAIAAVMLTNSHYWRVPQPSTTFHGRDIFAPVAAHLAMGVPLGELGNAMDPARLQRLAWPEPTRSPQAGQSGTGEILTGTVQHIDHFGNGITNLPGDWVQGKTWQVTQVGQPAQTIPGVQTYAAVAAGELAAIVGSHGWVELAVNQGSAQVELGLQVGDVIQIYSLG